GATLKGSIVAPPGATAPGPGVVIVQGAGPAPDGVPFHLVRFFAERGVATMTYAPRGTGGSTGDRASARFEDLAQDARAAARRLRAHPGVDSSRVGLYGFGEDGWVASLAASLDTTIAFVVLVSPPTLPPLDHLTQERREALAAGGMEAEEAEDLVRLRRRIWEYWLAPGGSGTPASDSLRRAFEAIHKRPWFAPAVEARDLPERLPPDEGMGLENHPARAWLERMPALLHSFRYDPVPSLDSATAPVLAIYGADDRGSAVGESERRLRKVAGDRGRRRITVQVFPHADRALLVRAGAGLSRNVKAAPGYEDSVIHWIGRVAGRPGTR
ncbi:MAG TPA: CocE/NonD family hydrolase, partial [Acidobacteriota bacterium]|nr:CocE/NonD family hydrolase [Acidobacteriota bacterium]